MADKNIRLAARDAKNERTVVEANGIKIGGKKIVIIAGPCAVESEQQIIETALAVKKCGADMLRGGAYKPRTSPYSFQGLGEAALKMLQKAKDASGLPIVTEVMDTKDIELVEKYADVLQIGARNMQNFALLKCAGKSKKPVLLKRGMSATLSELLSSAEYLLAGGNENVILCERGIRTFESAYRNVLDLNAVAMLHELTHLPVIADPSHATGKKELVAPLSLAAIAASADGVMVEVHCSPESALSDAEQSLDAEEFRQLASDVKKIAIAVNRE